MDRITLRQSVDAITNLLESKLVALRTIQPGDRAHVLPEKESLDRLCSVATSLRDRWFHDSFCERHE